jgi:O-antigen/teichoic acid export membrane protein
VSGGWNFLKRWAPDASLRGLMRHCSVLIAGDVASNGLQVISLGLTARALGAELFGVLVLIQTWAAVIDEIVNFASWKALIKFGAGHAHAGEREKLRGILKVGLLLDAGSALVATLLAVGGSFVLARVKGLDDTTTAMLVVNSLGLAFNISGTPTAILRLFERFKLFSVQKTIAAVVKVVGAAVASVAGAGLWGFLVVGLVAATVGRVLLMYFGYRTLRQNGVGGLLRARAEQPREILRFAVWTNLNTTVQLPVKQLDMAIVGALVSLEGVGVYKLVKQIALVMTMVSDSVYQVIYPRLAGQLARGDLDGALRESRKTGTLLFAFTLSAAIGVALFGPTLITLLFGAEYARDPLSLDAYMFLRAISCAFVVVHPLFTALGFVRQELAIQIVSNSLYLVAAWFLGREFGLLGIVLAYGVQFSSVLLPKCLIIRAHLGRQRAPPSEALRSPPG